MVALKVIRSPEDDWFVREMKILQRIQEIVRVGSGLRLITQIAIYKVKHYTNLVLPRMHRELLNKANTSHHGDLKPENIFVFREVNAAIISTADFGVSRFHRK